MDTIRGSLLEGTRSFFCSLIGCFQKKYEKKQHVEATNTKMDSHIGGTNNK